MFRSIVVGTDGSATAHAAVTRAAELAALTGADLHVVSAYKVPSQSYAAAGAVEAMVALPVTDSEIHEQVETMLAALARDLERENITAVTHARTGSAAQALLDVAEDHKADLIVVGSRGMEGARRLLGSVPNSVSHHACCSVLIVHTA